MVDSDYSWNAGAAWELAGEIYGRWNRKRVEKRPWRRGRRNAAIVVRMDRRVSLRPVGIPVAR